MTVSRLERVWERLVEPAWDRDRREPHRSRLLNAILLLLLLGGIAFEIRYRLTPNPEQVAVPAMIAVLALAYLLNHRGFFSAAIVLTIVLFISAIFGSALVRHWFGSADLSVLYYLIIPILMSQLFFSMRGYLLFSGIVLAGMGTLSLLSPSAVPIFIFLLVFCILSGFSTYHRGLLDQEQRSLSEQFERKELLLSMEQRKSGQLQMLAEVGRLASHSLAEGDIIEGTLAVIVRQYGYAAASLSLVVSDGTLEVAATSPGSRERGNRLGVRESLQTGIIDHVAQTGTAYLASDLSRDPHRLPAVHGGGSAIGVPMVDEGHLLGVLYVESARRNELQEGDLQTLQTLANQIATSIQKARLYARAQEHLNVMTTLQSISHSVASSLELNTTLNNVIGLLQESFGYTYLSIYLVDGDMLRLGAQLGYPEDQIIVEIPLTAGVVGRAVRTRQSQFVHDADADADFLRAAYEVRSELAIPLVKDEDVLGVLNIESDRAAGLGESDRNLLEALAGFVAVAIDNARLHAEVKRMALTDVLSGLANRRAFDEILEAEILRAQRYAQPLSLIILDLDSFKLYNDRWGHPAGDARLAELAELMRLNVREADVAARYGGEEFAIILPNTSKPGAIRLAERLRRAAEDSCPHGNEDHFPVSGYTISLGVATFPEDASSVEELLLMADNAELTAKRLGKNRVYATPSTGPTKEG